MTSGEIFNKKKVLISPLDWGLGHATRCIPVIEALISRGCEVIIAADGSQEALLKEEFPSLQFLPLKGYDVRYSRKKMWMPFKILQQLPRIFSTLRYEQHWLKQAVKDHQIDIIISDNRPGFYHPLIPCIYITHQLAIQTGNRLTRWLAQKLHYRYINRFTECWVPDAAGEKNLAGKLSHPAVLPKIPVRYLGPLSRFDKKQFGKKYDLLLLLSGPEPQRTIFEKLLMLHLNDTDKKVILARGLPKATEPFDAFAEGMEVHPHLSAKELNEVIAQSDMIISRSGYTTVMDLFLLGKKAIFVPTPGQTEQEYLAAWLKDKGWFYSTAQKDFSLHKALEEAKAFSFAALPELENNLEAAISGFVKRL